MLLVFPPAAFLFFYQLLRKQRIDWRRSFLASAIFLATCVVVINETLSIGRHLTRANVVVAWLVICVAILIYRVKFTRPSTLAPSGIPEEGGFSLGDLDRLTKCLLAGAGILVLLVGITAVVAPPNIWDAMEYHLPRVIMWMSNRSVAFYPTPDYAQLIWGPWSSYAMLHTCLLWGSDRFVNFVEFFSLVGSMIGVSLIAKKLGAGPRGQVLSAIVCATIPEGVLEASGPMNTYVVSFWIVSAIGFLMSWNDDPSWFNLVWIGLSTGLALLTKGTAYIFLPFLMIATWWVGPRLARVLLLKRIFILLLLVLAINAPQYIRCYELTGSPLGVPIPEAGSRLQLTVSHPNAKEILANLLRNVSLHFGTPSEAINLRIENLFRWSMQKIGVDPDDPRQIWLGEPFRVNHLSADEGIAGNPLQLVLLVFSISLVLWKHKDRAWRKPSWYALAIFSAFLLFCALLLWQRWASRYQLPLFVLGSALIGVVLERCFSRRIAAAMAIVLLAMASLFAVANKTRSLVRWSRVDDVYHPRSVQYFAHLHQKDAPTFIAAADAVNQLNCRDVAIDAYTDKVQSAHSPKSFYIYPLLALIHADGQGRSVWYTEVHNSTSRYAKQEQHPAPCAVICLDCADKPAKWAEYNVAGQHVSVFDYIVVTNGASAASNGAAGPAIN
jgi:Dolichyl-phosphate-mannose-protein mannosyltransferase